MSTAGCDPDRRAEIAQIPRTFVTHAVEKLLCDGVICRAAQRVVRAVFIIDKPGGEQIGVVIGKVAEQVIDTVAFPHHQFYPEVVRETLRQFVIKTAGLSCLLKLISGDATALTRSSPRENTVELRLLRWPADIDGDQRRREQRDDDDNDII